MKRSYVITISSLLTLSLAITAFSSIQAANPPGNPYSVYGYVTLNGKPAPANIKIILSIPSRADHTNLTAAGGRYTVDFDAIQGDIASFMVYVYNKYVEPINTKSFKISHPTPHGYYINLSVNATPGTSGPGGGGGGGGGESTSNQAPIADLSAGEPYEGYVNQPITFNGSKSYDPDGHIIAWNWTFGDGSYGSGEVTTHSYKEIGSYMVVLKVTDNKSAQSNPDYSTAIITIPNSPPTNPVLTGGPGVNGHKNTSYDLQMVSTDADNDTIKYSVTWGDGQSTDTGFLASGVAATGSHSWSSAGRFVISTKASDNKTESGSTTIAILIDAQYVGDLGYLIDTDGDGIYDLFYSNSTGLTTTVERQDDETYLINADNDSDWDYIYDPETKQISLYPEEEGAGIVSSMMLLGGILGFIVILLLIILLLMRKKKETPVSPEQSPETKTSGKKPRKPA